MIRNWLIVFSFLSCHAIGQTKQEGSLFQLTFSPTFKNSVVSFNTTYFKLSGGDSIQFETLKFYISSLEFFYDDKLVWKEENSFHLIDATDVKTKTVTLKSTTASPFNKIKFNIGIDSITNYGGAMGGDLDPTKGMYWTWQNGYINFKLEGKSNLCKTQKNEFQFHLGGYQYPYNTLQSVVLMLKSKNNMDVNIDLEKLFTEIDLASQNQIMSPSIEAVLLSKKVSVCFNIPEK
jgi:hypothetical protein